MNLKQLINKSVYGTIGYISSQDDIDLVEQYLVYNLDILKEYKLVIVATNFKNKDLISPYKNMWDKYLNYVLLTPSFNRGHNFGTADLDNLIFDYCKNNNIEWLCKSANDIILTNEILNIEIEEADFYYLNGVGYGIFFPPYNCSIETASQIDNNKEIFYPQTNFYFINVSKTDYLNDKKYIDDTYDESLKISNYNGKIWEYITDWSCENFLRQCVKRNNLSKYHLVSKDKYVKLLNIIKQNKIQDSSHKNIKINGICHFHFPKEQIILID
jgi:hypothetical protein